MKLRLLGAVCACLLLQTATSSASIIGFNINQTFSQGGVADLVATTISLGGAGQFTVDPGFSGEFFDFKLPGTGTFSTIATQIVGYYFLDSYSGGETIGSGNFGSQLSVEDDWDTILVGTGQTAGVWGSTHNGFLGFQTENSLFGWIEYSFDRTGSTSTLTFHDGAYNDVANADIQAGVPVPAAVWLFGSGLLGLVGMAKRKKA